MDRPTAKATKAAWIEYAKALEQRLDETKAESETGSGDALVEQLQRRIHELQRRAD
jgi:hypothetical protein